MVGKRGKKGSRKNRKSSRRNRRSTRRQSGGWQNLNPAGVDDKSMNGPAAQSNAQGQEYLKNHVGQHGGGALYGAPVGDTGVLDSSLRDIARVGTLDKSMAAIQGMSDQAGGGRRRKSKKGKGTRKGKKGKKGKGSRKSRKGSRKSRKQRGGAALHPAEFGSPGSLLPPDLASKALSTMNPEWKLAENPASFAPGK
jgi:hypothetical protein